VGIEVERLGGKSQGDELVEVLVDLETFNFAAALEV